MQNLVYFAILCFVKFNGGENVLRNSVAKIEENPVVCFNDGCVRGKNFDGYEKEFEGFLGIPYAKPPVGQLRLKNPEPAEKWKGVKDVQEEKMFCIQKNYLLPNPSVQGVEDCLYLYVYRPKIRARNFKNNLLPVMVYIHGGGFFAGTGGPSIDGPDYIMDTQDVLMVHMNYRLGPLGFMSTGDENMPGNFGLKDQALAIKWVKNNIKAFGGDSNAITVMGQSAGAASTHLHMMSPLTKNLFHRAILMSGSAIAPYANVIKDPLGQALKYAEASGIKLASSMSTEMLANEFRKLDAETIVNANDALKIWSVDPLTTSRPVVEKCSQNDSSSFLCDDPRVLWANGDYGKMPMLMGHVPVEGAVRAIAILENESLLKDLNSRFDEIIGLLMEVNDSASSSIQQEKVHRIKDRYFNGTNKLNEANKQKFVDIFSERAFIHPLYKTVQQHVKRPENHKYPIYIYKFAFKGPYSYSLFYTGNINDYGVVHCDDLIYMLHSPVLFPKDFDVDSTEGKMRKLFVRYLVDFAVDGVPTKFGTDLNPCEPTGNKKTLSKPKCKYTEFSRFAGTPNLINIKLKNDFDTKMVDFWDRIDNLQEKMIQVDQF